MRFNSVKRFRHSSWLGDGCLYVGGGFRKSTPNIPTDVILRLDIKGSDDGKIDILLPQ